MSYKQLSPNAFLLLQDRSELLLYSQGKYYAGKAPLNVEVEDFHLEGDVLKHKDEAIGLSPHANWPQAQATFMSGIIKGISTSKSGVEASEAKLIDLSASLRKNMEGLEGSKEEKRERERELYEAVVPIVQSKEDKRKDLERELKRN